MALKNNAIGMFLDEWKRYRFGKGGLPLTRRNLYAFPESILVLKRLNDLYLDQNNLSSLPPTINELENLETLYLSSNKFSVFPELDLKNLISLEFAKNLLKIIPDSIAKLPKLRNVDFSYNQIEELPAIGTLQNLWKLNLSDNKIRELPASIGSLANLEKLNVSSNQLQALPTSIFTLPKLRDLNLSSNQLSELPVELNQMMALSFLNASHNNIAKLSVNNLPKYLFSLNLSYNKIDYLPDINIKPQIINFDFNPLKNIPVNWFKDNDGKEDVNFGLFLHFSNCALRLIPDTLSEVNIGELNLHHNHITALPPDLGLDHFISRIDLSNNPITHLPEHIFEQSRDIILNDTKVQYIPELDSNTDELNLRNTPISEFPDLRHIKILYSLDIRGTSIEKIPSYVKDLKIYHVYIDDLSLEQFFNSESNIYL